MWWLHPFYRSGRNLFVGCNWRFVFFFKKSDCLLSLGVTDSRSVPDNRITASSSLPGYPANEARLNSARGWCAAEKDKNQFVQIDFGKVRMNFIHIRVQIWPLLSKRSLDRLMVNSLLLNWFNFRLKMLQQSLKEELIPVTSQLSPCSTVWMVSGGLCGRVNLELL